MASKSETVRITYKELESSVQDKDRLNRNSDRSNNDEIKKKKNKRPTQGIYQPPRRSPKVLEAGRVPEGESWEGDEFPSSDSKETSSEREIDDVSSNIRNLNLGKEKNEQKKQRSKKPEIQRYVPKGKILEQQTKEDDTSETEPAQNVSPRKIDLKKDQQELKVTVVNEGVPPSGQLNAGGKTEAKEPPSPHNPLDRSISKGESPRYQSKSDSLNQFRGSQQPNKPKHQKDFENKPRSGRNVEERRFGGSESEYRRGKQQGSKVPDRRNREEEFKRGEGRKGEHGRPRDGRRSGWQEEEPKPQRQPKERRDRGAETSKGNQQRVQNTESEEGIQSVIPTMVFERKNGNSSEVDSSKQVQNAASVSSGNGKPGSKRYSLSAMRRPRAGSISSDVSNTSDLSMDEETTNRILDWSEEVEREMAENVHDETRKLQEYLDQKGGFNDWDGAIETVDKARQALERGQQSQRSMEEERNFGKQGGRSYGNVKNVKNDKNLNAGHKEFENGFRQRRNSDGARSRRKDNRRKGSSTGRRSRDSSVSSAHSVRSYHTEDDVYGTDTWPRRRNRRRGSNASVKESRSKEVLNDPASLNLKVTFARDDKRQVMMKDRESPKGRGRGRGRGHRENRDESNVGRHSEDYRRGFENEKQGRYNDKSAGSERQRKFSGDQRDWHGQYETKGGREYGRRYEHRNFGGHQVDHEEKKSPESPAHGGGIIKLPANTDTSENHSQGHINWHHGEFHTMGHRGERNRNSHRDTHAHGSPGQRMLFDPKNPEKMIMVPTPTSSTSGSQLKFKDPSGQESPQSPPTQQHPLMPPPGGFPPMPPQYRGYPPFYAGYDPRYQDPMYGGPAMPGPSMPGYYYGYPAMYRDNPMLREDGTEFSGDGELDPMYAGRSRAQCRMMAEHLFQEACHMDSQMTNLVSRRQSTESMQHVYRLRQELQQKLEQIILLDVEVASKHNVEQLLWKSVYYQVIEMFRRQLAEDKEDKNIKTELSKILDEGTTFFDKLLQKLQQKYGFDVEDYLDSSLTVQENQSRNVKLAVLSIQRLMINLGDIARYREQMNHTGKVNYGRARSWYTKAQQLAPKNGRPYNQLAILGLYTRRKLDAVYYYMRSLAASNPFLTAREGLLNLFDEARKKALAVEQKKEEEREKLKKLAPQKPHHGQRIEIWVSPDGTSSEGKTEVGGEEDLDKLEAVELNKRFNLSFLNVHGKLFTKVGRESFPECCGQMLKEFQALLRYGALPPSRLIQLMAINMFAIENTALKDLSMAEDFRSELQEHAVQLGLDMFGILLDCCAQELTKHLASSDYPSHMFSSELEELIPGVKKWTDWMLANLKLWNPPPSLRDTTLGPGVDVWKVTAKFANILKDVDISHVKLYEDKIEGCESVVLFEDTMLSGFVPLMSAPIKVAYVHSTVDKDIARDCLRIQVLQEFADYLCGVEPPMLEYDVVKKEYYSVAPSTDYSEAPHGDLPSDSDEEADVIIESEEEVAEGMEGDEHVRLLRQKKEELRKKKEQQLKDKENIQKLIEKDRHRCIELEIHPIFLIPDTNCFIEHFSSLKQLIQLKKFTVVVPLIVINELDGLAKGSKEGQYDSADQAVKVAERSKQMVEFLEEEFDKKNSHLKALTSKGNVLETISFRSEEGDSSGGNNDDIILSCCLHYCKDKAREFMPKEKDAPVRLYREVVLLTDDRNLRLKAHTCNVPVKDVLSFLKWSKIT
ncbi:telomerase-binding protein EST1A-like [Saccostrea cucullata]|uniref:telomerase-binding protein EST1A-like n=1 Tax=Saccostrea cuccullata TaxID=36930 RepID=UPI002ED46888